MLEKSISPEKLKYLNINVQRVVADIPRVVWNTGLGGSNISEPAKFLCRALPGTNSCISLCTVAKSLMEILNRFEAISREAIDALQLQQTNERE